MDPKQRPNLGRYLDTLRKMTPEARLLKSFDLTKFARTLFRDGLRRRFPDLAEDKLKQLMLERLEKCHNRNY